jgi:uncharacterized membrane protein YukC
MFVNKLALELVYKVLLINDVYEAGEISLYALLQIDKVLLLRAETLNNLDELLEHSFLQSLIFLHLLLHLVERVKYEVFIGGIGFFEVLSQILILKHQHSEVA